MNTKHTPAPWLMNVKDKFCNGDFLFITDINDRVICKVSHDLTEVNIDEYSANAKVIAAAPELLEALQNLLKNYNSCCELLAEANGMKWTENNVSIKAKQAIKKATE